MFCYRGVENNLRCVEDILWGCVDGKAGRIINVYRPAGKMEEFFREIGKPFKDLPTREQMENKTYTLEQVKSLRRLFDDHGMKLLPPPGFSMPTN